MNQHSPCRQLLFGLLVVLLCRHVLAAPTAENIQFEHLSTKDGLIGNNVTFSMQDSLGFIWIAMYNGLQRYDGVDFVTYTHKPQDPNSLSQGYVYRMMEDQQGYLWMANYGGGLNRFDRKTETFTRYQHHPDEPRSLSNDNLWAVHEDLKGRLWIGSEAGLDMFDQVSGKFLNYRHDPDNPHSLSNNTVTAISDAADGGLWLATHGGGLNHFNPDSEQFSHYRRADNDPHSLSSDFVTSVLPAQDGLIWVGTENGLNHFKPTTGHFTRYFHDPDDPYSLAHNVVNSLYLDHQGRLWLGRFGGLHLFVPDKGFIRYQADARNIGSLSHNYILHINGDSIGTLWVSTLTGISRYDPRQLSFRHYQARSNGLNSLAGDSVTAFHIDDDGIIWIGTDNGMSRFDRHTNSFTNYRPSAADPHSLSHSNITDIHAAADGGLWVLTDGGGLNHFDPGSGHFTRYRHDPANPEGFSTDQMKGLAIDAEGRLWIGMYGHGIERFDPTSGEIKHYPAATSDNPDGPLSNWMLNMFQDEEDHIWSSSQTEGLSRIDPTSGKFTHYQAAYAQSGSRLNIDVHAIHKDSRGILWIGASNGLNRLDPGETQYRLHDEENNIAVSDILEDNSGWLWLRTATELIRLDPEHGQLFHYDRLNGFRLELPTWGGIAIRSDEGEILFGGTNGFVIFDPATFSRNTHLPPVVLTEFDLFNQPVSIGGDSPLHQAISVIDKIVLSHQQSTFSFKFAALNYLYPFKNQYAYKLHGYDQDWLYADSNIRVATYTNIDPGEYRFQVRASNNDGQWNNEGVSIAVIIQPVWWETLWFRSLMFMLLCLLVIGAVRWRMRSIEAHNRILTAQVENRTKQLHNTQAQLVQSEKMASLGVLVAGVAHEVNNPVNFVHVGVQNLEVELDTLQKFLRQLAGDDADQDVLQVFEDKFQECFTQLQAVRGGSERISGLVGQLRTFSRLDEAEHKTVSLTEGLDATIQLIQSQFREDVEILRNYQVTPNIKCLPGQLNQVFMNLMINACQAIQKYRQDNRDDTPGTLTITTRQDESSVYVCFQDTGCGMSEDVQKQAFDPFFTTKPVGEGTGLGLSISHEIIEKHLGHITLAALDDHGTLVTVCLPLN